MTDPTIAQLQAERDMYHALAQQCWDCTTTLWLNYPQGQGEREEIARAAFYKVDKLARAAGILARPVTIKRETEAK